jgi:hypothetical protein
MPITIHVIDDAASDQSPDPVFEDLTLLDRTFPSRNELKTRENSLGGRNRVDFGTVRPRVQIPGPRPKPSSALPLSRCHQVRRSPSTR